MTDSEQEVGAIKQRRAVRHALAAILALPPMAMFILRPPNFDTLGLPWPLEWQAAFVVCMALSLAIGWKPAKEAWTGEDRHIYVDEPEVDDDW